MVVRRAIIPEVGMRGPRVSVSTQNHHKCACLTKTMAAPWSLLFDNYLSCALGSLWAWGMQHPQLSPHPSLKPHCSLKFLWPAHHPITECFHHMSHSLSWSLSTLLQPFLLDSSSHPSSSFNTINKISEREIGVQ